MEQRFNQTHVSILLTIVSLFVFLWLVNFFNISYPISVTNKAVSAELSVVGIGEVDVVPDTAQISAGITIQSGKTVAEVESKMNEINNKIIAAVKLLGIEKEDIQTSNYSINPAYSFEPSDRSTPNEYTGNATLTIKVKDANKISQVITAATAAGANQVYNAGFSVDDPSKFREEARNKAIEDAKSQAQKLASQLGIKLGKITNIVESDTGGGPIMYKDAMRSALPGEAVPAPEIEPGSQTITSTVTLFFERR